MESSMAYQGLPITIGRSKTQVFQSVREKVCKKLIKVWKRRFLLQAGREILIKTVVQAIPSCYGVLEASKCYMQPD